MHSQRNAITRFWHNSLFVKRAAVLHNDLQMLSRHQPLGKALGQLGPEQQEHEACLRRKGHSFQKDMAGRKLIELLL